MFLLTSIAWPYPGVRYWPTEFDCFIEIIRWHVATFQMIAGSSSFFKKMHMKYVVFMSRTFELTSDAKVQPAFTCTLDEKMDLLLQPGVNRYAKTTFAQIYSPVCTNLHRICAEQIWSKSMFSSSGREGNRFLLFSLSRVDHALRPIFMFRLVKIWQVSSYGKLMPRLETCLLSFVSSRDVLKSFFTCCTKWNTAAIKIVL